MKLVVRLFSKRILSADTMSQMNCVHCDTIPHNVNITSNFFIEIENWFSAKFFVIVTLNSQKTEY